ncbi:hypothetical protein BDW59DRAFT_164503 [Aspergillus cavernicola]|uniref:Uncharacterized protein n=1 Tax=Aspergillus cavernicola TaxID=176166 RepID=A0ABR4HZA4_9EURO
MTEPNQPKTEVTDPDTLQYQLLDAIRRKSSATMRELLQDKNAPIHRATVHFAASEHYPEYVFQILVKYLAKRRKALLKLARESLPPEQLESLGVLPQQNVLDSAAAPVAWALKALKVIDDSQFEFYNPDHVWLSSATTVWSLVGCNLRAAHVLHEAGFQNVDEVDQMGYSPLAVLEIPSLMATDHINGQSLASGLSDALSRYLTMCSWLRDHGASMTRGCGLAQATPMHHIGRRFGQCFAQLVGAHCYAFQGDGIKTMDGVINKLTDALSPLKPNIAILQQIAVNMGPCDLYLCACAGGGCLASNTMLNEMVKGAPVPMNVLIAVFQRIIAPAGSTVTKVFQEQWILRPILRACTFACLKLRHSCQSASLERFRVMKGEGGHTDDYMEQLVALGERLYREKGGLAMWKFIILWFEMLEHAARDRNYR